MSEDAVAPVVAAMLLLAIGVTVFAAWNAYYIPSMKEQSEITHIREVETGFLRFSSDIETAVSLKNGMKFSEQIPLGGGDFLFDPVKSGGELKAWNSSHHGYLRVHVTSGTEVPDPDRSYGLVKFTYRPANNFWQDQGYGWAYGNVYVLNTGRNLSTPLLSATADDLPYGLAGSLVALEPVPAYSSPGNCTAVTLRVINISADSRHFRSGGNGNGLLVLESTVRSERVPNTTGLDISITGPLPARFRGTLWDSVNASVERTLAACGNVRRTAPPDAAQEKILLGFDAGPDPGITLIRETTEITIGAY